MNGWVHTPIEQGWYWHRFYTYGVPIYNLCSVMIAEGAIYIHYLGELKEHPFSRTDRDAFWGPIVPPF